MEREREKEREREREREREGVRGIYRMINQFNIATY